MVKGKETFEVWRTASQRKKPNTRANPGESITESNAEKIGRPGRKKNTSPSPRGMKVNGRSVNKANAAKKDVSGNGRSRELSIEMPRKDSRDAGDGIRQTPDGLNEVEGRAPLGSVGEGQDLQSPASANEVIGKRGT